MLNPAPSKIVQTLAMSVGIVIAGTFGSTIQSQAQTVPSGVSTSQTLAFQIAQGIPIAEMERMVFTRINQYRASKGLPAMAWNDSIAKQAREHSRNMAKKAVPFGHQGFEKRAKAITSSIPARATSENVAWIMSRRDPIGQVVEAWIKSQKHRENIEGNFNVTGIGIGLSAMGEYYFTQDFVRN
ncbi:CAP domain-containing protein [Leptolyngbya sp. DQ-M1]|uniref:CAP domain-containing protein n=1 Tax=Leptolyngbya sp. DQ-M1 TaxID=2933920 RepID=UPI003298F580